MKRAGHFLVIVLLLAASLGVRSIVSRDVFRGERTYFFGTDPYYHMRRVVLALHEFPHVPVFDAYVNYPSGVLINWPSGFDLLLASAVRLFADPEAPPEVVDRICAAAVPVMGVATVLLLFLIARQFFSFFYAFLASFLFAFSGAHVLVSRVGRVDHHVLELFFPALAYLLFLLALRQARQGLLRDRALRGVLLVLSGLSFGLSFTVWTGSVMFLGIFILYAFAQQALFIWVGDSNLTVTRAATLVIFSSCFVLVPLCASSPWGRRGEVLYLALSWFQVLVPLGAGVTLAALDFLRMKLLSLRRPFAAHLLALTLIVAGVLALVVFLSNGSADTLRDTWDFLSRGDIQIHSLGESQSLWVTSPSKRAFLFGHLFWFLPLVLLYALFRPFLERETDTRHLFLLVWLLSTGALTTLQVRFAPAFALPLSLYLALILRDVQQLASRVGLKRGKPALYRWVSLPLYLFLFPATVLSSLHQPSQAGSQLLLQTFYDIRTVTPSTSHVHDPGLKPEYGILAFWPWGHHLNYISERPNIANPFGQAQWYLRGVQDSYRFLLQEDEAEAFTLARAPGRTVRSRLFHRPASPQLCPLPGPAF